MKPVLLFTPIWVYKDTSSYWMLNGLRCIDAHNFLVDSEVGFISFDSWNKEPFSVFLFISLSFYRVSFYEMNHCQTIDAVLLLIVIVELSSVDAPPTYSPSGGELGVSSSLLSQQQTVVIR